MIEWLLIYWMTIIYSPSCCSKPVRVSFFCSTQKKIFWRIWVTNHIDFLVWKKCHQLFGCRHSSDIFDNQFPFSDLHLSAPKVILKHHFCYDAYANVKLPIECYFWHLMFELPSNASSCVFIRITFTISLVFDL